VHAKLTCLRTRVQPQLRHTFKATTALGIACRGSSRSARSITLTLNTCPASRVNWSGQHAATLRHISGPLEYLTWAWTATPDPFQPRKSNRSRSSLLQGPPAELRDAVHETVGRPLLQDCYLVFMGTLPQTSGFPCLVVAFSLNQLDVFLLFGQCQSLSPTWP
jgi:hypothetical protein